jgi:hypothetical protein
MTSVRNRVPSSTVVRKVAPGHPPDTRRPAGPHPNAVTTNAMADTDRYAETPAETKTARKGRFFGVAGCCCYLVPPAGRSGETGLQGVHRLIPFLHQLMHTAPKLALSPFVLSVACVSKRTRGTAMDGRGLEERGSRSAHWRSPSTPALRAYAQDERLLGECELWMRFQNGKGISRVP